MKFILLFLCIYSFSFILQSKITIKAETVENKDLDCITLLKLASEKSMNDGETEKYEKLKKLKKSFQDKYRDNYFSKKKYNFNLTNIIQILWKKVKDI